MKIGRPTKYTEKLGIDICKLIMGGKSLKKIGEIESMPSRATIHNWLLDNEKKGFLDNYEEAVNVRTENMFDELNDIADSTDAQEVGKARLRVDTRKWYLSKVMPKKFGDKMDMTSNGEPLKVIVPSAVAESFKINGTHKETTGSNPE